MKKPNINKDGMTLYQQVIHQSRYARWIDDQARRETFDETCERYVEYFGKHLKARCDYDMTAVERKQVQDSIKRLDVMPSMRTFMTAGKAVESTEVSNFNCSAIQVDHPRAFAEHMYILMSGAGSGFSIEKRFTDKLPEVPEEILPCETTIVVSDSRKGWCTALNQLLTLLYSGSVPKWDVSKLRPEGARLKTFGGYSSGPGPLVELFETAVKIFNGAKGRKLRPIEVFSLMCMIAQIVVVGGVRRCRDSEDYAHTSRGLVKMKNLNVGDRVLSINGAEKRITGIEDTGKRNMVTIRTKAGDVRCTPDHRVAVYNSFSFDDSKPMDIIWKEARNLTPGEDHMAFYAGDMGITATELISHDTPSDEVLSSYFVGDNIAIKVGAITLEEWAWLTGMIHDDGCVHMQEDSNRVQVSISICSDMPETRAKAKDLLERLGVYGEEHSRGPNETRYTLRIRSQELGLFLSQWKLGSKHLSVPDFVMRGDAAIRLSYLAGVLDANGSCNDRTKRQGDKSAVIAATTPRPEFFRDLKALVSSVGAPYGSHVYTSPEENWNAKHILSINTSAFKDRIAAKLAPYSEKVRNNYNQAGSEMDNGNGAAIPVSLIDEHELEAFVPNRRDNFFENVSLTTAGKTCWSGHLPATVLEVVASPDKVDTIDIEVEDTQCFLADGHLVHNSATIALFDKDDIEMRRCKSGQWWINNPHYAMANIAHVYESKPSALEFMDIWRDLIASGSGEAGVLNRQALWRQCEAIGRSIRDANGNRRYFVVNPCSEIILRPYSFCNLSGVAIRPHDTLADIKEKIRLATIIGTWQCTVTNFEYLRKIWKDNVDEERLLGVCLAGIMDHPVLSKRDEESARWYTEMREEVWAVNKRYAKKLGIPASASVTALKPAGNCRPWDGLVTTDKGIFTMEEYALGTASGGVTTDGEVVGFNINGDAPTYKITMKPYNVELECTADHRWRVEGKGMVACRDLVCGDEIQLRLNDYVGSVAKLDNLPIEGVSARYKTTREVTLPTAMNSDLAWLFGYLWGDGSLSFNGYRLHFIDNNERNLQRVKDIVIRQFGIDESALKIIKCTNKSAYTLDFGNKQLWHWLMKNEVIKYACTDLKQLECIPRCVRCSSKEHIIAFIAGMFDADGHTRITKSGQTVAVFCSDQDTFTNNFQHIALSVGLIFGRSLNKHGESFQKKKHVWLCALSKKSDEDSLSTLRKHCYKIRAADFRAERDQKKPAILVDSVTLCGVKPVFDVTTNTGEYTSGAFVSHNSGEMYNVSSGIHPRYAEQYIRTIRQSQGDPMTEFLKDQGVPWEVSKQNPRDVVFSFPIKSPEGAIVGKDLPALEQLEHWLHVKRNYATHTISCTIYVKSDEWLKVGAWVYEHFDEITGLSFLPYDDHVYEQAPYQPITIEEYKALEAAMPKKIDWTKLKEYEKGIDTTTVSQEFTCVGGACEYTP